ncbi:Protein HEADING DATE 3A [Bienertia sinuspersici]
MPRNNGRDSLVLGQVIGDVIDPFIRCANLRIIYENRDVINACEFRPSQVINPPRIEISSHDPRVLYTLVGDKHTGHWKHRLWARSCGI